jgi:microcystin-dependent protein
VDNAVPVGTVAMWAGANAPANWLFCNGGVYNNTSIPLLAPILANQFNAGTSAVAGTSSAVPNFNQHFPWGTTGAQVGQTGGEINHTLAVSEMPSHAHGVSDPTHTHGMNDPGHAHSISDPGHNHGFNDPQHIHGMNDPGHGHGLSDPGHAHGYQQWGNGSLPVYAQATYYQGNNNATTGGSGVGLGVYGSGTGTYLSYGVTRCYNSAAGTGIGIYGAGTGVYLSYGGTGVSVQANGGSGAHNNMPPWLGINFIVKYQ